MFAFSIIEICLFGAFFLSIVVGLLGKIADNEDFMAFSLLGAAALAFLTTCGGLVESIIYLATYH